jgi:hypothetical protein
VKGKKNPAVKGKKNPAFPPAVSPNHGKHPDGSTRITTHKWQKSSRPFIKKSFFSLSSFQAFFAGEFGGAGRKQIGHGSRSG